ncbi:MAG: hypothetical protein ACT4PJ_11915 [Gemmatimonadaceae bacterium]
MRIKCVTVLATLALVFAAVPSAAQVFCIPSDENQEADSDAMAACLAATTTPFGALPTLLSPGVLGRAQTGIGFNASFASMSEEGDAGEDKQAENGTGFALGGGVSFGLANGVSFDVGFKKVMIDEANALIGLGISFQR